MTMNRNRWALVAAGVLTFGLALQAAAASPTLLEIENAFTELAEKIRPVVVNIEVSRELPEQMRNFEGTPFEDFFRFFGQPNPDGDEDGGFQPRRMPRRVASGSGFIFDEAGHIITNNHVVEGADLIRVTLWNDEELDATVVGRDPQTDLAVIKVETDTDLPVAQLGDSSQLRVGQYAIAVGNPQGLQGSFSFGHVTALGRGAQDNIRLPNIRFYDLIQTDAAINLGNSGGPLCDIDGRVIGINVAIVRWADALGFAIPVNTAKDIVNTLISEGKITRGYLGVTIKDASEVADAVQLPDEKGALVETVVAESPAEKGGIEVYDVIRKVNGSVVDSASDLQRLVSDLQPGETAVLEVWRDGETVEVRVQLEEYPEDEEAAIFGEALLGLRVRRLTSDMGSSLGLESGTTGVLVSSVEFGSPADRAGIQEGDVVIEVAKQAVGSPEDFRRVMKENMTPGSAVLVRLLRPGRAAMPIITSISVPTDE
jgi:serine protease Do